MPEPKPYQDTGIDFLAARSAAILGDDAGLGKSLQLIRAADKVGAERVIVGCPAIGRVSWRDQFTQWQIVGRKLVFWPSKDPIPAGPVALVVTYDWLSRKGNLKTLMAALDATDPFDVLMLDEVHYLKSLDANRTHAAYGRRLEGAKNAACLAGRVSWRWIASATLTPGHAAELYTHIKALFPSVLITIFGREVSFPEFRDRFCHVSVTPFGVKITGNNRNTIPQLKSALAPHILVRKKLDVLQDLDPIRCLPLPFEIADEADDLSGDELSEALDAATALGLDMTDDDCLALLTALALRSDSASTQRRALGMAKVPQAVEWTENFLGNDRSKKLVIFAHHTDVIETLRDKLGQFKPALIYGKTPASVKGNEVARFQNDPACRLFIGQTLAAGTSITLTAASDVLLLEPDWTPVNNYQAISRCHRIGQRGSVSAYFAFASGTVDERISAVLRRKAADAAQLFGANPGGHV